MSDIKCHGLSLARGKSKTICRDCHGGRLEIARAHVIVYQHLFTSHPYSTTLSHLWRVKYTFFHRSNFFLFLFFLKNIYWKWLDTPSSILLARQTTNTYSNKCLYTHNIPLYNIYVYIILLYMSVIHHPRFR